MQRSFLLYFLITLIGLIFIGRLFQLQIIKHESYDPIHNAAVKIMYDYPERGYVYDRNGKLLIANQLSYDVMVQPNQVKELDTLEFCKLLNIDEEDFLKRFKKAEKYATYLPSVFLKQLAKEDFAFLQEKLHKYRGFYIQKRIIRDYPIKAAANVLGYIGEVNEQKARENDYYQQGELEGKDGIERQYENELRGRKGKKYLHRNRFNKVTGSFKDGIYDTLPENGKDLMLTLDIDLQVYAQKLMKGKRGGIVAIEPSTGEILALVTAPSYDPNMLVGRKRSKNSVKLFNDTISKPSYDRGLLAAYAPGSPFKMMNALIGLQEKVINQQTGFSCYGGYRYGNRANEFMKCHCDIYGTPLKLKTAIAKSCNSYFSNTYKRIVEKDNNPTEGVNNWHNHVASFGLGNYLGYDLPAGQKGLIPDGNYYNRRLNYRWNGSSIISNAIGQGEILTTPIQLANFTAAIANRGYFYTPHIVKKIDSSFIDNPKYIQPKKTTIDKEHFEPVIEAMHEVFKTGTGRWSQVKGIEICGKTGTAENFVIIEGIKKQLADHSILVAFAPKKNPKIALAVFVENGGYGSTIAAPITSLLIEKYINGEISAKNKYRELNMLNKSLQEIYDIQLQKPIEIASRTK
ncbi:penicillin-binding protein 2 [Polaribacter reichenbachii]|uniref:Penicillin-binding protein n=1 Tax=Polaribacter reichenbachii TaxID=996801 RepID=A0A1B8TW29_9FLAO|nr:penicillin-binding protein 2 [Polaribacter reichenbachii]APZ45218.1 penicillin-binding protein 2 [Polaribacter reichenbachii]AUC19081.1 penicillin-binding protein 2 [Polaribacter reichenbachii]OBY63764.1 penicillin-binding protein [Polaribacter reichenbachii]